METVIDFSDWIGEPVYIESDGKTYSVNWWLTSTETGQAEVIRTDTFTSLEMAIKSVFDDIKYQADLDRQLADAEPLR